MGNIKRVRIETYDGTVESAANVVKNLKLGNHQYFLDVTRNHLYIHPMGIRLSPGDCYHIPLPHEKFEAIG